MLDKCIVLCHSITYITSCIGGQSYGLKESEESSLSSSTRTAWLCEEGGGAAAGLAVLREPELVAPSTGE